MEVAVVFVALCVSHRSFVLSEIIDTKIQLSYE